MGIPAGVTRWLAWMLVAPVMIASAQSPDPATREQRQQERERILRQQQEMRPDVRLEAPNRDASPAHLPVHEAPCFSVRRIVLAGEYSSRFNWALAAADAPEDRATGRCLGTEGINIVMARVQDAIIARGFVTSRVLAAPQDLRKGTLTLTLVAGRIGDISFSTRATPHATLGNAVPAKPGDLLNIRDVEQALENLQRVPTVTADVQIAPANGVHDAPGQSDLLVAWTQTRRWRFAASLDDGGSDATGKWQAGATLSLDNPLGWNDLLYVNLGQSVARGDDRASHSWTAHYDVPLDYWLLGATASGYDYRQAVAGPFETYTYRGSSRNAEMRASRILLRGAHRKSGMYVRGWWRESDNFINDVEIEVQRRRMAGWEAGFTHKHFIGTGTLEASAGFRRGTGALGALRAPEESFGEGTSRSRLIIGEAQLSLPLQWGRHRLRYASAWRAQWNRTRLVQQDRFAIGGRYTVRGFDGETSLSGERGWTLRNELGLGLGGRHELYSAIDHGHVAGPSTLHRSGRQLTGMAIGLRGGWRGVAWDGFFGAPLSMPDGFRSPYTTFGFNVGWSL